jgi:DHA2 family multidrug resistance protein-like MFS transporter
LIAARGLLGVAGSTLLPSTLSLVRNIFHNETQRTFAIGLWTTCFSAGTMLGPLVGGFLLSHFWWGSVFLMGVPVMVLFLILGPLLLPEFKDPGAHRLDLYSVVLLIISILPIVFGIKQIAEYGMEFIFILPVLIGVAFGIIFLRRQCKLAEPLIDLNLFRIPKFGIAMVTLPVSLFMWAGIFVFVGQYLQLVLNMDPLKAGLWTLPAAVFSTIMCMCTVVLAKIIRKSTLVVGALVTMGIGLALLTQVNNNLPVIIIATILLSSGCGLAVTLSTDMVMTSAPPEKAGTAAGMSETSTALGASFGIALLGSIGMAVYRSSMAGIAVNGIAQKTITIAQSTLGAAVKVSGELHNQEGNKLINLAQQAFIQSFRVTAGVAAIFIFVIAVVVAILFSRLSRKEISHKALQKV